MASPVTYPGELVVVAACIEPAMREALIERARENERTLSAEIRLALRTQLELSARSEPDTQPGH